MFADDAMIWIYGKICDINTISDLENISKYLRICKLKLNVSKTKFMCIGSPSSIKNLPKMEIVMEQQVKERVSEMKYLRIMIDENLNFK